MPTPPDRRQQIDAEVVRALARHGASPDALLPILRDLRAEQSAANKPTLGAVADALGLNDARLFGVASFYSMFSTQSRADQVFRVCDGPVCMLRNALRVRESLIASAGHEVVVERSSCLGLCDCAPAVQFRGKPCGPVAPDQTTDALVNSIVDNVPMYGMALPGEVRVSMARIGRLDPESIDSAIDAGAYDILARALSNSPSDLLDVVEKAGLRGCGGAGFPTGRKWRMVAQSPGREKFVICNADESEPGTFKDRVLMWGDPHLILEGMALAGYAIGASTGIIYIRGEYDFVARRLEHAVAQAASRGWLGRDIQGRGFDFQVRIHRGAGAYICGEETALLESLEGKRGEPRMRPPYPTTHGYHGEPTLINNVETLSLVPAIVAKGPNWFRSLGTPNSPGTKVFTVTGCVNRPGAFEVPLGITLREIIEKFAEGMHRGARFKAALTGGAAGLFVPESLLDLPIEFDSFKRGVALGSGAMIILDDSVDLPKFLTWLLHFFEVESCGKCTPCREGTRELRLISERIANRAARSTDLAELNRCARLINQTSLCGLGQSAAWPVESALRHFADEFTAAATVS